MYILHSCPGYDVNKAGNVVGRNYIVKKDQNGGCITKVSKQNKHIFCLQKRGAMEKVMLLLICSSSMYVGI